MKALLPYQWLTIYYIASFALLGTAFIGLNFWLDRLRRPLILSERATVTMLALAALPFALPAVLFGFRVTYLPLLALLLLPGAGVLTMTIVALASWKRMTGIVIIGADEIELRAALRYALERFDMPYHETVTRIRLFDQRADLKVSTHSWSGTGLLEVEGGGSAAQRRLRRVTWAMGEYFRRFPGRRNSLAALLCTALGTSLMALALVVEVLGFKLFERLF